MAHRTYEDALSALSQLQSNRAVTSLFSSPPPPPPISTNTTTTTTTPSSSSSAAKPQDLNALAIPEMLHWLRRAGISPSEDLSRRLRCIHVAGTKGKGSVCAYLTSILTQPKPSSSSSSVVPLAGRVGTYTSPHLLTVRERIAIDGRPLSRDRFARYFFEVWDAFTEAARREVAEKKKKKTVKLETAAAAGDDDIDTNTDGLSSSEADIDLEGPATKPFYFRFLTILALHAFLREGVRTAIIECGIGGEYDATNVLGPGSVTASVVAQLGVDHVGMLGGTLPEIAWHKVGVAKRGRKCFTRRLVGGGGGVGVDGDRDGVGDGGKRETVKTMEVLRKRAEEKGAVLVELDEGDFERVREGLRELELEEEEEGKGQEKVGEEEESSLGGDFQVYNQALAIAAAAEHLRVLAAEDCGGTTKPGMEEKEQIADPFFSSSSSSSDSSFRTMLQGIRQARLRGRCETRRDGAITWFIDGAHTAESLGEAGRWFAGATAAVEKKTTTRRVLLFNQQERDAAKLLGSLYESLALIPYQPHGSGGSSSSPSQKKEKEKIFDLAVFTRNEIDAPRGFREEEKGGGGKGEGEEPPRDLSVQRAAADAMMQLVASESPGTTTTATTSVVVVNNVTEAVERVRGIARGDDDGKGEAGGEGEVQVLVTGSLHLVGAVLRVLEPGAEV
ncbi:FolC bifunctional protein [Xylariomycetidae sp. FL2044]|nr:FolC bifunctional protein [Xylariomycetidae sp. FL2044]